MSGRNYSPRADALLGQLIAYCPPGWWTARELRERLDRHDPRRRSTAQYEYRLNRG